MTSPPTLSRPLEDRWLGGVCAGLARRFGVRSRTVRILAALSLLLPGPSVVVYIVLWVLLPNASASKEHGGGYVWS